MKSCYARKGNKLELGFCYIECERKRHNEVGN